MIMQALSALSRGKNVVVAFAVMVTVFATTHMASFPGTVSYFHHVTHGQTILDLRASSSADETWQRLDAMGVPGRDAYLKLIGVVDVVFPLSVTAALLALALFTARKLSLRRALKIVVVALPIAYLTLDFAENALILRLLLAFPERLVLEGELVGWLTRGKRFAEMAALLVPLTLLLFAFARAKLVALRAPTGAPATSSRT